MEKTKIAKNWRKKNGYLGKGGVVIVYEGEVSGWVWQLEHPHKWVPGAMAIDENGSKWIAEGGNPQDGAQKWVAFHPKVSN